MAIDSFNQKNFKPSDAKQADILTQDLDSAINKKNKIEEQAKRDLLDAFLDEGNSKHIDDVANLIESKRKSQKNSDKKINVIKNISTSITYCGSTIQKSRHEEIYKKYNEILKDTSLSGDQKEYEFKKTDRLLAARTVLMTESKSLMYTFKRRAYFTTEANRNTVFYQLDAVEPFKGNIVKTTHKLSEKDHYFIQWKDEVTKIPTPTPTPKHLDEELDVNFSDMQQTIDDIADERIYNEDSKDYIEELNNKNTRFGKMLVSAKHAMFGDWFRYRAMYGNNPFKKGNGKGLRNTMIKDKQSEGLDLTSNWSNIATVHANQGVEDVYTLLEGNSEYAGVYNEISDLAKEYYRGGSTFEDSDSGNAEFEKKLKEIFAKNSDFTSDLEDKGVSIDRSAGDILQTLKIKKAQNKLKFEIKEIVEITLNKKQGLNPGDPLITTIDNDFVSQITSKFKIFTSNHNLYPELLQHYNQINNTNDKLNLSDSYEDISKHLLAHIDVLGDVASKSMENKIKLNIKFLAKGHSTDHIEKNAGEEFKWYKNPIAKLGDVMYGKGYRWRRFQTKALATGLTAAAGTVLFGPLGGILAGSITAGSFAAGKKSAQLNRKKDSLEKEFIKGSKDTSNFINDVEREQLESLEVIRSIANVSKIKKDFDKILSNSPLDEKKLMPILSLLMAGLDFQKKTGHNGFSIDDLPSGASDMQKEHAYDKSMSELHKYKKLAFMRLDLQGSGSLDEKWIKKQTDYKVILDTYMGKNSKFKKFVKSFKKDRTRLMLKTGARTAAIYGAAGGLARGLHHMLGGSVDASDVLPTDHDLGEINTNYDLGKFDASTTFSNDVGAKLSNLPSDTASVQVDYFAGVDGTPANSASFSIDIVNKQVSDIQSLLNTGNFSQATIDSVNNEISQNNIDDMINIAQTQGADAGNQNLFASRNLEGIYETLKQVDGKQDIDFNFKLDNTQSIIGRKPYIPEDRLTGINLTNITKQPEIIVEDKSSLLDGQGIYTEDNTHKGAGRF